MGRSSRRGRPTGWRRRSSWGALFWLILLAAVLIGAVLLAGPLMSRKTGRPPPPEPAATQTALVSNGLPGKGGTPPANVAPAAAPVWTVDKTASRLAFRASLGGQPVDGVFKSWDAEIAFDPANLKASHATIVVETASAVTGEPTRDELLPTANWLSTRRYPRATLTTRSLAPAGPGRYVAVADLRIRGIAKRITVPFTLTISHDVGKMQAAIALDRAIYGIGEVPGMPLSALAPRVDLNLRLVARKGH